MVPEPFIVYDPPYGGQAIRCPGAVEAWERTGVFLRTCTDANPDFPESVDLTIFEPSTGDPTEWYDKALKAAEAYFGRGERRSWLHGVREDFSTKSREYCVEWRLVSEQGKEARSYLTECGPWPRTKHGPVSLTMSYTFRWINMDTRAVLSGQVAESRAHPIQATSDMMLWLGKRSSAIFHGRFPFPAPNGAFVAYIRSVAPFVPVQLLAHRFRHWIPTKGPSEIGYKRRKVDKRLLDKITC